MTINEFTATKTVLADGRTNIKVFRNGEQVGELKASKRPYTLVNIQVWPGSEQYRDHFAPRYGTKPIAPGAKIEYGVCLGTIVAEEVA